MHGVEVVPLWKCELRHLRILQAMRQTQNMNGAFESDEGGNINSAWKEPSEFSLSHTHTEQENCSPSQTCKKGDTLLARVKMPNPARSKR